MNSSSFSPSFGNAGEFDCGFGFSSWSGYHPKSTASVRARPRLVKLRKPLNGKVRTWQSDVGTGFKPSSAPQNPNATPVNSTAFPQTDHSNMNSSSFSPSFGNAGEFDCGFGFSSWSGYHPKSTASVRARPRLVKLRKPLNGKVRTWQSDVGTGFNPFKQSGQDSGWISTTGNLSSSGFSDSVNIVSNDNNCNNANNSDNSENSRFIFGVNNGGNVEVENGNKEPIKEFENRGFAFEPNLRGSMEKLGSEKCGKFGFVFGANGSGGGVKSNLGKEESSDFAVSLDGCNGKLKVETGAQDSKDSNLEFTFGSTTCDLGSNFDLGKEDFSATLTEPYFSDAGFVFGSSQSNLKSTSNSGNIEPTNVASCMNSSPVNLERRESDKNTGRSISGDLGMMNMKGETESQKLESTRLTFNANGSESCIGDFANGFFVFGATSCEGSFSDECKDGTNAKNENFGVSDCNGQCKDVSEHSNNIGSSSSAKSMFTLQNDLQKVNISCDKNVGGSYTAEDSDTKVTSETTFVFGSSVRGSSPLKKAPVGGPSEDKPSNVNANGAVSWNSSNNDNVGISGSKPNTFQAGIDKSFQGHGKDDVELNGTDASSSFNLNSQGNCHVTDAASFGTERNDQSCSASTLDQSGFSFFDFKTPGWRPSFSKENRFPEVDRKFEFGVKSGAVKAKRLNKMKGKSKKSSHKHCSKEHHVQKESSSQENQDSQCYSPMDFSPYQETTAADQSSKVTPQASEEASPLEYNFIPSALRSPILSMPEAECTTTAQKGLDSNEESVSEAAETASTIFKSDCFYSSGASNVGVGLNGTQENNRKTQSCFDSSLGDERNFTFSATPTSEQGSLSFRKPFRKFQLRKNSKVKVGSASFIITPSPDVKGGSSSVQFSPCDPVQCEQKDKSTYHSKEENGKLKQGSNSSTAAAQEACEMWRLRGNQAYRNDNLSKAEEFYTQGINSVPSNEASLSSIEPLVLCYSNRAATRMSLGRMREALADCLMAAALDPNFFKVYVRAANCHLLLGETENAIRYFSKCLGSGADVCLDRRITIDAAEGLQKAQRVDELSNRSVILLEQKSSTAASNALDAISEALSISSCSEKLLEMKAEALYMLRKYEEAIQLCEQSLDVAEKNFSKADTDNHLVSKDGSGCYSIAILWRWHFMSKSYFCMGKLEKALNLLQKLEQVGSMKDSHGSKILEVYVSLAVTIQELLRLKLCDIAFISALFIAFIFS
ncbi:hypothetical protein PTKIN_Ptkin13bG0211100 [Pterospermum kingtungense]